MSTGDALSADEPRRVCLLTGAGGTLGSAFCRRYAARYDIVAVCRRRRPPMPSQYEEYLDPLAPDADLPENRARVYVVHADLDQPADVERIVEAVAARHGRVDLLVNAAAYSVWHPRGLLDDPAAALADLDRHLAGNVAAPLRLALAVAGRFWQHDDEANRRRSRNVVNVSSLAGAKVFPGQGQALYAASKAALNQLTRHLADEFATFGVRVNALAPNSFPSVVATEAVADAVARLDAEAVTGQILAIGA